MKSLILSSLGRKDDILCLMFTHIGYNSDKNIFNDIEDLVSGICDLEYTCLKNITLVLGNRP